MALPPFNPTLHHYNDEVKTALRRSGDQPLLVAEVMPERWHKTVEQLDQLAALYESNGVQVYRPRPYSEEETEYLAHLSLDTRCCIPQILSIPSANDILN
ncbi:MAG: hypothetical protein Ct9H300mP13_6300 [Gammaproteobacteria bacterium]|nr:MAG: hypothetical protein Ct9H300mP13_6300 [Gammaproteobacteria bacterium]